jgi:hypothetical protein
MLSLQLLLKSSSFPADLNFHTPHSVQEEHLIPDLLLGSVALERHVSNWEESRNQDPEVLNLETTYVPVEDIPPSDRHQVIS